jgi:hypothetical protein
VLDLVASKLLRPSRMLGTVGCSPLIERSAPGVPLLPPLVWPGTIRWSQLRGRPDDGGARPVGSVVQGQTRVPP